MVLGCNFARSLPVVSVVLLNVQSEAKSSRKLSFIEASSAVFRHDSGMPLPPST